MKRIVLLILCAAVVLIAAPAAWAQYGGVDGPATVSDSTVSPGDAFTVSGSGFAPNSTGTIVVESVPQTLGGFTADASGGFTETVRLPADLSAGSHTVKAVGTAPDGSERVLATAITVVGSGTLARTGATIGIFVAAALGAVALGTVLIRLRRPAS